MAINEQNISIVTLGFYLIVFVILVLSELLYFRIADKFNIIDRPNQRSSHSRITLRGGGIVFYFSVLLWFFLNQLQYPWFVAGLTLIVMISFVDDIKSVSSRIRLIIHFLAMLLMFYQWGLETLPWWYIPIALIICTGIINAYNFMDGINGMTGGYSLIILATLLYVNNFIISFANNDLLWFLLLAVIIFNFFNFRRNAVCFAGDVGAICIAFIILFLLGRLIITTQDLSYIIILVVYGIDSVLTIIHRLLLHENIGLPHRKHLYQIMANELKIPHVMVSGLYMTLQTVIIAGYFWLFENKWFYFAGVILLLSAGYYWFIRKYFYLHLAK